LRRRLSEAEKNKAANPESRRKRPGELWAAKIQQLFGDAFS
jgi:hypothetical protein